ncbi:MAG: hypothetical protein L6R36_002686 [Xanthoria steineri]|nr:MAG: hypothetical protein L6R36_002686 [Xanthoria steineri]
MFFKFSTVVALSTIYFLDFAVPASAGHSRFHCHQVARQPPSISKRDTAPGMVEIPLSDLQLLRAEMTAFQGWMHSWITTVNASDPVTNLAQLKLEFQAYDGWMTAWLDSTLSPTPESPPPLPSSIPITTSSSTTTSGAFSTTSLQQQLDINPSSTTPSSTDPFETTTTSNKAGESLPSPSELSVATTLVPIPSPPTTPSPIESPTPSSSTSPASSISSSAVAASPPAITANPPPSNPTSSGSTNDQARNSVAVYYGQSPATSQMTLAQMCQDENVDIVILAFLTTFFGAGGYPGINLGAACGGPSQKMQAAGASGLLRCPTMENDIKTCQSLGKKILLSLGGAQATTAFASDTQAADFATKLWNLFGAGAGESAEMRPFGAAVLDGFDIDNEDHSTAFYNTFTAALRAAMNVDASKRYYLSAAPQCPRPDASIPLEAMQAMDFVFVQFYNNGDCNIGQPGFAASLKAWSQDLAARGAGPKLYVGVPGCAACAGSGYLDADQMKGVIEGAMAAGLSNFGGVMLWDGPEGKANVQGGRDYLAVVKGAMG